MYDIQGYEGLFMVVIFYEIMCGFIKKRVVYGYLEMLYYVLFSRVVWCYVWFCEVVCFYRVMYCYWGY